MNNELFAIDQGKPTITLPSHLIGYWLNLDNPDDQARYKAIKAERRALGIKLFDCIDNAHPSGGDNCDVDLETTFLFDNQWNTTDGRHVFDWYESIVPNRRIKIGYFLTITPEMTAIRANTCKCGYCGAEYYDAENSGKFCGRCIDSEYLKEEELHFLRVMPINYKGNRPPLSPDEASRLLPFYVEQQTTAKGSRAVAKRQKQRADIEADYQKETTAAKMEHDGLMWLWERNISLDNVIFYDHSQTFCFGWRHPLDAGVRAKITELLEGFPYHYEMK